MTLLVNTTAFAPLVTLLLVGIIRILPEPTGMAFSNQENSSLSIAVLLALVLRPLKALITW